MKNTRNRDSERLLLLLDMLRSRHDHPDAKTCIEAMKKRIPGIGQSTIYRHLAFLVEHDLVQEIHPDDGPTRFDATTDAHAHYFCTQCLRLIDVPHLKITGTWPGTVETCFHLAKGICNDCNKQRVCSKEQPPNIV